ncbi:MAG: RNA methyltransferase [Planctomycetota bacterium]
MSDASLHTVRIEDPADPRVAVYRNQKDAWLAVQRGEDPADKRAGLFMAEGELVVRTLLASRHRIHSVLISDNRLAVMADALAGIAQEVPIYVGSASLLESIVGFAMHRGVLAAGVRPGPTDIDSLLADREVLLIAEDLANHDNVGGVFRSLAAIAGVDRSAVLLSPRCCDPLYRKALRVSMGTVLQVPWAVLEPWPEGLDRVRAAGYRIDALTPAADAVSIDEPVAAGRVALLLGAEGPGLTEAAMAAADRRVRIPIDAAVDSLNAAVSASVAIYALGRSLQGPKS